MSYGPPPANPPGPPSGGYGPPSGGQPGGYSEPTQHGGAAPDGQHSGPQGAQYGPPQGGQYGPPQGSQHVASHGGGRRSGFDPKSVNPLDWGLLAAGLIALIFSFFKYYEYKPKGADAKATCSNISSVPASVRGELQDACNGIGNSAWHGFFGWFGVLLALLGAILIALVLFAPSVKLPVPARIVAAGLFVLAALSTLIALFVIPDGDYKGQTIDAGAKDTDAGHGFSYWIVLIVIVIGAVLAIMRFLQTGGSFSDLVGKKGSTGSGTGYGQGYPAPAGGQPGYQQPVGGQPGYPQQYAPPPQSAPQPPPSGYQPPAAPPPSYQTPPASAPQPPPGYQQGPPPGYQPPPQQGPPPGYQPPPQQGPPPGYQPPPAQPGRDQGE